MEDERIEIEHFYLCMWKVERILLSDSIEVMALEFHINEYMNIYTTA